MTVFAALMLSRAVSNRPAIIPPRGFEPLSDSAQRVENAALTTDAGSDLPVCLPDLAQNDRELAALISAWPGLSDAVRARIVGIVEGATAGRGQP